MKIIDKINLMKSLESNSYISIDWIQKNILGNKPEIRRYKLKQIFNGDKRFK